MLDRDEDMMSTGTRHSFLVKYKVNAVSANTVVKSRKKSKSHDAIYQKLNISTEIFYLLGFI